MYHSILGLSVIKKEKKAGPTGILADIWLIARSAGVPPASIVSSLLLSSLELSDTKVCEPQIRKHHDASVFGVEGFGEGTRSNTKALIPPCRQPRGKSQVNLPQMPPDFGGICVGVD